MARIAYSVFWETLSMWRAFSQLVCHIGASAGPPAGPEYHRSAVSRTPHALDAWDWFRRRTYHHSRFGDPAALVRAKEQGGLSVSVCLPTRNEADTVADIVR